MKALLSLLVVSLFSLPQAFASGGILRNGEVVTIGSSGLRLSVKPLEAADLPELQLVSNGLRQLVLPLEVLGRIHKEMRPSPTRRFFKVERLSLEDERRLVEEYRKLLPELPDSDRFTLIAMTDQEKDETFLLPAYAQLPAASSRAAVLFHEGIRATGLVARHDDVVTLEGLFETALRCAAQCGFAWDDVQVKLASSLDRALSQKIFLGMLASAARTDGKANQLAGILTPAGDVNFAALLGAELFNMVKADLGETGSAAAAVLPEYRETRLLELQEKWPQSRLVRILLNTPFKLSFLRVHVGDWTADDSDPADRPGAPGSRLTPIPKWSLNELQVKFSQKTITYGAELEGYYLNFRPNRDRGSRLADDLWQTVQPVDTAQVTSLRKVYQTKDAERWGPVTYHYFVFGFTLN